MPIKPFSISSNKNSDFYDYEFSIFTLVNDKDQYKELLKSFEKAGFNTKNSEFGYLDNILTNSYDGFSGLNRALHIAKGKYIILVHQDVRLKFDGIEILKAKIESIEKRDPKWAVLGNAGGNFDLGKKFIRISDPANKNLKFGSLPAIANSLDENFLLIKSSTQLAFSEDLEGFHFYGTDICQQAIFRGFTCYVIDFHLMHYSSGNKDHHYFNSKKRFIENYGKKLSARFLRTTTTRLYLSGSKFLNLLFNQKDVLFILRKTKIYKLLGLRK